MGLQPKSLPEPNIQGQLNPLMLAMASGFTWIGRGYSFNVKQLVSLIQQAIEHPGLAYLDVLQPCPTYNNLHTKAWFAGQDLVPAQPRVYELADADYDPHIPEGASEEAMLAVMQRFMSKAHEWGDRIPTGVFLINRSVPTFAARIARQTPGYDTAPPACRMIADAQGRPTADLSPLLAALTPTASSA
jgi:2-oxoglutarate ferredoxin oxidoreductase subunit beta